MNKPNEPPTPNLLAAARVAGKPAPAAAPAAERLPTADAWLTAVRERTPARLLVGRAGSAYRTATLLALRADHAAARDAVDAELDPALDFDAEFAARWQWLVLDSSAADKREYLMRPDLGRRLSQRSRERLSREASSEASSEADVQFVVGDGLSAAAVLRQVPRLLPDLVDGCAVRGWRLGRLLYVRYCRVAVMNDVGDLLRPRVVVLLIGERPGLATAQSLSAYFAYRPRAGCTDADRNLISNIHDRGLSPADAAPRILDFVDQLLRAGASGVAIKEDPPSQPRAGSPPTRLA